MLMANCSETRQLTLICEFPRQRMCKDDMISVKIEDSKQVSSCTMVYTAHDSYMEVQNTKCVPSAFISSYPQALGIPRNFKFGVGVMFCFFFFSGNLDENADFSNFHANGNHKSCGGNKALQ